MADILDIEINIGANTQDLGAEIQKAENLLSKLQSRLKKSTDVGEIQRLNTKISSVESSIGQLNTRMNALGRPTNDATNALSNLSRVAQDAPFGFMAISNNLNPLLESFQRLSKESGSTGAAFKSMVSGLTGPAGIGLALGVVSAIIVKYGDDISNFIAKTLNGTNAIKEHAESIKAGQEAYMKAYTEMYNLNNAFDDFNNGLISKKELLKQYNDTLGDTYGKTNNVTEAEKIWEANSENFVKAAVLRAAALSQIDKAAKKAAEAFEAQAKPKEAFTSAFAFVGAGAGGAAPINLQAQTDRDRLANQKRVVDGLKAEESFHLQVAKSIEAELKGLEQKAVYTEFIGKELPKETKERAAQVDYGKELVKQMTMAQNASKAFRDNMKASGLEMIKLSGLTQSEENEIAKMAEERAKWTKKKLAELAESTQKEGGFGFYMEGIFKKDKNQLDQEAGEKKRIEELTQSYAQFAQTLSSNVTNALFSMYDAMQQGENPLEALANAFLQIGKNIAAMVIQALIFEKIMNAFPALKGAFAALGLVGNALSGARVAGSIINAGNNNSSFNPSSVANNNASQSQFVLKGSDLVLATQRANNNLNIRRGY